MKSENFFNDEEKQRIESAIAEVEKKSSGEIVAMVVDRSSEYRDISLLVSLLTSSVVAVYPAELVYEASSGIITRILPMFNWVSTVPDGTRFLAGLFSFLAILIILYFPFRAIVSRFPILIRMFILDRRMEKETRDRAVSMFHEKNLSNTRDATGVLFLISLFERKVYVLADHGIYEKMTQHHLDGYASSVAQGIAKNHACESLVDAIQSAGRELAEHFPVKSDDTNELSDRVLSEK